MSKAGHCPTPTAGILAAVALLLGGAGGLLGICGPFIDVSDPDFCQPVLEIFILGITTGATPTTYSPADPVDRLQMAGFLSRAVDTALKRGSRREALGQFWTPKGQESLAITTLPGTLEQVACDGADVWVAILDGSVTRIRASDGRVLRSWRGAQRAFGILAAMGRIVVLGTSSPGLLYTIDPSEPEGAVESQATLVAANLGNSSFGITFDGARIWTANNGTVSIVTPSASIPWTVTNVTVGFVLSSALFDGANVWVTDANAGTLIRLDSAGARLQTITVGPSPEIARFDGANIWVPVYSNNSVSIVRASSGAVIATLTGNGLNGPWNASFDGERVLVLNRLGHSVSLWKAADLSPLGSVTLAMDATAFPIGVCNDGLNFWISTLNGGRVLRF